MKDTRNNLPLTVLAVEQGIARGLHTGAQVYVSRSGQAIANIAIGESQRGLPMSTDTLMLWQSCTKPLVAAAFAQLWEKGILKPDQPVCDIIPEFAPHGKDAITFRHILTHTAGFRFVMLRWFSQSWEQNFQRLCEARLEPGWTPGQKAGYHAASSWFILAEAIHRADGRPIEDYLRQEIFMPLDMGDCWLAMSSEQYHTYGDRIGILYETSGGEIKQQPLVDEEPGCTIARPGSSGRGPARELGRFYECLLNGGTWNGYRILSPQTVEAATARHRVGMYDYTFGCPVDWGLGFLTDSSQYETEDFAYTFGSHCSRRTYGHGGYQSSLSFADPESGVVVVILFNGTPGEQAHGRRMRGMLDALYEDLGPTAGARIPSHPG